MWVWHVYLGLPGRLNLSPKQRIALHRCTRWFFVPVMETLVMSEMRAYEILRDNLSELSMRSLELPWKKYDDDALRNFQGSSKLQSREWKEFMISPEPRTYRALKLLFGYEVKSPHVRKHAYLLKMKIERKKVHS